MTLARLLPIVRKEFLQMRRDRISLGIMVGIPVIQLLLFGYAIQTDVKYLPTVVLDESRTPVSRDVIAAFANTANFRIVGYVDGRDGVDRALARGDAAAAIIVPREFPRELGRRRTAAVQVVIDAADPLASQAALAGAAAVAQLQSLTILMREAGRSGLPVEARVRPRYNPGLRTANYIVPGLVGTILSITMVLVTAMAIVRERERGTLEQLIVTPITKTELMLGKIVPYVCVGLVQMTAILALGHLVFAVPLAGNLLLLYAVALLFIVANLSLGLVVSTLVKTQGQAMQASFMFILPNILLSGFMFPRAAMPDVAQWIGLGLPLTYFLKVVRGIVLKGADLTAIWREAGVLALFSVVLIAASVRRFHKTLD